MKFSKSAIAAVALLGLEHGVVVKGQTNHIVNVGLEGSFFDPSITSAQVNDTVTFLFQGDVHTVTQSSFDTPCVALPGGFNSGAMGVGANLSSLNPIASWTLTITNSSAPIYFFCEISRPMSHCNSGMVGAINALPNDYNAYLTSAKQATGTPKPSVGVVLSGVGAFATAAPSASGGASPATSPPASQTSGQSTPATNTPSPTPSSSNDTVAAPAKPNKLPAIVGGAVGGVVALFLALFAVMMYRHRQSKKKHRRRYVDTSDRSEKRNDGMDRYASSPASDQVLFNKSGMEDSSWADRRVADYRGEVLTGAGVQRNATRSDDGMRGTRDDDRNYERYPGNEPSTRLVPNRPGQTPPLRPPPSTQVPTSPTTGSMSNIQATPDSSLGARSQAMHHQRSFNSTTEDGSQVPLTPGAADPQLVQALAQQVAAILQNPGVSDSVAGVTNTRRAVPMVVQNHSGVSGDLGEEMRYTVSADGHPPPTYRARQSPAAHPSVLNAQHLHYGDEKF
ncbi:hypothetical protein BJ165DRAFT_1613598 [Panaeolus papilionaceus]|nr:hypothetical protein BJ165DRAFT_1613598 [Panaeolus papilionaceus]